MAHSRGTESRCSSFTGVQSCPCRGWGRMEGGTTGPEHLGSCQLRGRSAVPLSSSGLQTPRWPQRAWVHLCDMGGSRGLQGLLHLRVQRMSTCPPPTVMGAAGTECPGPTRDESMSKQRALRTRGSRKGTRPQRSHSVSGAEPVSSLSSYRHCKKN